ncbi:glycoside hydrolase 43 family protein [Lewinella sp. IMCC34183]|uniref:glycoside hydrolase family 43 protein n=1 Tax=Lewinella sp. IMCC34183 TaxID=2248762 RepID=UPI000E2236D2|nr:glycoside hydrolase 43 family protein [Lewinella sp. IMCC34183]
MTIIKLYLSILLLGFSLAATAQTDCTWTADNGNGTYTNPLFHDEFSDPDLIRVGDDYYLTGTTMHAMPGLPVLHSRDLVNWELLTYAAPRLDKGPAFRLEDGQDIYGQGFWAPCLRYDNGTFYIFSNVNGQGTQVFTATDPAGPWKQQQMRADLHDLTVLFDDDGKKYAVWGYNEVKMVQLTDDLLDVVPGTERVIVPAGSGAGEGSHIYKIDGKYIITNTNYEPMCYQVCLRADAPYGPYEVNVISAESNMGVGQRARVFDTRNGPPYNVVRYDENYVGCIPMHQGGIVQTQTGEWWGWSMLDYNSVGRVTGLSPVTWQDGWPYFGLPGNLTRTPRSWVKPNTGFTSEPSAPFVRDDAFNGPELGEVWQWNHAPVEEKWSLDERPGYLRLHSLPAESFWRARNSLTQRGIGPESVANAKLELGGLHSGDVAGLALLNLPYAWIGVLQEADGRRLRYFNEQTGATHDASIAGDRIWLRAHANFDTDTAVLSYSLDGKIFTDLGAPVHMPYQLRTFQGVRYALFNYSTSGGEGGYADFDDFTVDERRCKGLTRPIPHGKNIRLTSLADSSVLASWRNFLRPFAADSRPASDSSSLFRVLERGPGRIALQSVTTGRYVTVHNNGGLAEVRLETGESGDASTFQWEDMLQDDLMLMSLTNHRYLFADPGQGSLCSADARDAWPDRKGGACFRWALVD